MRPLSIVVEVPRFKCLSKKLKAIRERWMLIALLIIALLVLSDNLNSPFVNRQHYNSSFYSNIARNYLRYGFTTTLMGQVITAGVVNPINFKYYTHHPPLLPVYIAISFIIFGVSEWAAMIVPVVFSLGAVLFFYRLVERYWGKNTAFLSTFILVLTPMFVFYGKQICYESPILFFSLVILYYYLDWFESRRIKSYLLAFGGFFFGVLTDWPVLYLLPLLSLHSILFDKHRRIKQILLLWAVSLFAFGLFMASLHAPPGGAITEGKDLINYYLYRANMGERSQSASDLYVRIQKYLLYSFTKPIMALSAVWLLSFASRFKIADKRMRFELGHQGFLLMMLFLFGAANILLILEAAFENDYYLFYLMPYIALSSALGLLEVKKILSRLRWGDALFGLLVVVLLIIFLKESYDVSHWLPYTITNYWGPQFGLMVKNNIPADKGVLIYFDIEPQVVYYADRYIVYGVDTVSKLQENLNNPNITFKYIIVPGWGDYSNLEYYLDSKYPARRVGSYIFYDISPSS